MSFADALLQERQEEDEKTREKVDTIIQLLECTDGHATIFDMEDEILEAVKYLKAYRDGGQLR